MSESDSTSGTPSAEGYHRQQAPSVWSLAWPVGLSILALVVIGYLTWQPDMFAEMWTGLHWSLLGLAGLMVVGRVLFGGLRLYHMSHKHLSLVGSMRGQIAWDFASNITPSAIGGAPIAAMFVSREGRLQMGEATAVMLLSMVLDQIWLATMIPALIGLSFHVSIYPEALGWIGSGAFTVYFIGMLVWIGLLVYATLVRPGVLQVCADKLFSLPFLRRFKSTVMSEMKTLHERAHLLRSESPGFFLGGFLLTGLMWSCRFAVLLFVVWSVYDVIPKLETFARTAAMMLAGMVIPTPGGSGGIEGLYALFVGPLIPATLVAPTLLTWRFLNYYLFLAAGIALSTQHVADLVESAGEELPVDGPEGEESPLEVLPEPDEVNGESAPPPNGADPHTGDPSASERPLSENPDS